MKYYIIKYLLSFIIVGYFACQDSRPDSTINQYSIDTKRLSMYLTGDVGHSWEVVDTIMIEFEDPPKFKTILLDLFRNLDEKLLVDLNTRSVKVVEIKKLSIEPVRICEIRFDEQMQLDDKCDELLSPKRMILYRHIDNDNLYFISWKDYLTESYNDKGLLFDKEMKILYSNFDNLPITYDEDKDGKMEYFQVGHIYKDGCVKCCENKAISNHIDSLYYHLDFNLIELDGVKTDTLKGTTTRCLRCKAGGFCNEISLPQFKNN